MLDLTPFVTRKPSNYGIDSDACLLCQRPIHDFRNSLFIHCVDGTIDITVPADEAYDNEAADMGWWPVGPECAKKLPDGYAKRIWEGRGG